MPITGREWLKEEAQQNMFLALKRQHFIKRQLISFVSDLFNRALKKPLLWGE